MISFTVAGEPVPQPRVRVSTRGGFARAYVPSKHPVHDYRRRLGIAAKAAGLRPAAIPLVVAIVVAFGRPKSHASKSGLRKGAPVLPRADVDNLAKAILDAMQEDDTGEPIMGDDSRVARLIVEKKYAPIGESGTTRVVIWSLDE